MLILGITGTRQGLTPSQETTARVILSFYKQQDKIELHHGDCLGVDLEVANLASDLGMQTVAHPPRDEKLRAFHKSDTILPSEDYLVRNCHIVDAASIVLAFPKSTQEEQRGSGTWAAIRYARKANKTLVIIWPDGTTDLETLEERKDD